MLGQVVVDRERSLAVVEEVLGHRAARVRRQDLIGAASSPAAAITMIVFSSAGFLEDVGRWTTLALRCPIAT